MYAQQVLVLAAAGLAAAQSTTSSAASSINTSGTSGCGSSIDAIISSCLESTTTQLNACATNDWDCLCEQSNNVLTCYNNCPADPRRNGVDQQNVSYCNAAKAYGSSASASMSSTMTGTATGSSGTSMASATASNSDSESTGTATSNSSDSDNSSSPSASTSSNSEEASSTESTGAAANVVIPSSLLAAIFGLAAIF